MPDRERLLAAVTAGTVAIGNLAIVPRELVARGGAGSVYAGALMPGERPVAVKFLTPPDELSDATLFTRFVQPFERERKLLMSLRHPALAQILGWGQATIPAAPPDTASQIEYYVMDLYSCSLKELISGERDLPEFIGRRHILDALSAIAGGLEYLHARKIIHLDIKPLNILVDCDAESQTFIARLADLGSAKVLDRPDSAGQQLRLVSSPADLNETLAIGTPRYAPPYARDILNVRSVSRDVLRSQWFPHYDMWCFALTVAELVSGDLRTAPSNKPPIEWIRSLRDRKTRGGSLGSRLSGDDAAFLYELALSIVSSPDACGPVIDSATSLRQALDRASSEAYALACTPYTVQMSHAIKLATSLQYA